MRRFRETICAYRDWASWKRMLILILTYHNCPKICFLYSPAHLQTKKERNIVKPCSRSIHRKHDMCYHALKNILLQLNNKIEISKQVPDINTLILFVTHQLFLVHCSVIFYIGYLLHSFITYVPLFKKNTISGLWSKRTVTTKKNQCIRTVSPQSSLFLN